MGKSKIEYIDYVINDVIGCTPLSDGCKNCYAKDMYERFDKSGLHFSNVRRDYKRFNDEMMKIEKKKGMVVGYNFMADTFHEDIFDEKEFVRVLEIFSRSPQHQFIIFTKRYKRLIEFLNDIEIPNNVHFGVSICNNKDLHNFLYMDVDVSHTFSEKLIVSFEPLLEQLDVMKLTVMFPLIKWAIVGAESGSKRRPYKEEFVTYIKTLCEDFNVPFYHKQQFINNKKTHLLDGKEYLANPIRELLDND